jgi:2,5-furandicarboxylate decarboxylase 1
MVRDMRTFLGVLEDHGELLRIEREVNPHTTLAALAWEAENKLRKATWFETLSGYPDWTAVSYIHGSRRRIALGLGTTEAAYIHDLTAGLDKRIPCRMVTDGPVKDVVWKGGQVDLGRLPIQTHSTCDPSPYLGHICIVKDPETGIRNVSVHRMQIQGKRKTGISIHAGRHMDMIYKKYEKRNEPMPIAFVIGHHPAYYVAGCWSTAFGIDELEIAGGLMGEPAELVACEKIDLEVPAHAEVVVEGEVPPHVREIEGPFGEHHGLSHGHQGRNPIVNVNAITMRDDAIYYALQGGRPIAESQILDAVPQEVDLYKRLRNVLGYVDLRTVVIPPYVGGSHIVLIQMVPEAEGQTRVVLMAALSSQYPHMKIAIELDEDVDPNDPKEVWWSISTRVNPHKDIFIIPDTLGHSLDVSLDNLGTWGAGKIVVGSKMGIDATKGPKRNPEYRTLHDRIGPKGMGDVHIEDFITERRPT